MRWLLRRLVGRDLAESIIGDLEEHTLRRWPRSRLRRTIAIAAHIGGVIGSVLVHRGRIPRRAAQRDRGQIPRQRSVQVVTVLQQTLSDLRFAWRRLRATPVFTSLAALTLAIGVGATTAVYSAMASLDLTPIAVRHADRLAFVTAAGPSTWRWNRAMSQDDFDALRRARTSFVGLTGTVPIVRTISDAAMSDVSLGEAVAGPYFETLGVPAVRGRLLQPADDRPDGPAVVVLSGAFWRRTLQADAAVIGRVLRVGGRPFEVVGVAGDSFGGLSGRAASPSVFWIPLTLDQAAGAVAARDRPEVTAFGRFGPSTPLPMLSTEVAAVSTGLDQTAPLAGGLGSPPGSRRNWSVTSGAEINSSRGAPPVGPFVVGLVALLIVIGSTNIANLVVGRGASRAAEFAVRRALGASRMRLIRELLAESALLALLGGVGAYMVARALFVVLAVDLPVSRGLIVRLDPEMNLAVFIASAGALLLSLVVFGVAPALQLTRTKSVGRLAAFALATDWRSRRRSIAGQVAASTGLLLLALTCARVSIAQATHDSGIDVDRIAVGIVNFRAQPWTEATARPAIDAIIAAARQQRGVESVSLSSGLPLGLTITPIASITTPDKPFGDPRTSPMAYFVASSVEIFRTLGVPVLKGRAFDSRDAAGAPRVAVVSQVVATRLFGGLDPIGRELLLRNHINMLDTKTVSQVTVVGVARDTDTGVVSPDRRDGTVYVPLAQHYEPTLAVVARTSGDPASIVEPLRNAVRMANPDLALSPMSGPGVIMLTSSYVMLRIFAVLTVSLASIAMLFAMAGLYGVLLQLVAGRTREMGLRAALGALPAALRRLVLRDGLRPVIQGLTVGLALSVGLRLVLRSRYPDISILDPVGFIVAPLLFLGAALVACYIPARRASRVDPNVALRDL